ncbi:hypothetical protein H2198_003973 [Neophaeococcomyces mojaviensis]|uniref:Uncharacterized protein n=1 Tax=Neophaeococcomyces mojaviensis TaxID=3383035 RepID=A0ACC3AAN4_9EURO|nr:hypothetical protein H2198_003973 [Knufia sp. JES_112]
MSFLGDIVSSIGGEKAPAPPIKPPSRPASTNALTAPLVVPKSAPVAPPARPIYKGTANAAAPQQGNSLKRKAEEISTERPVKLPKPSLQSISDRDVQKPSRLNSVDTKSPISPKPTDDVSPSTATPNAAKTSAKPPQKGSYAEIMARAKEAQQSKIPSQIGMITHKPTEKIRTSKLAERKREDQEKGKIPPPGQAPKANTNGKVDPRRRSTSPVKKGDPAKPAKIPKAPQPPLHAPAYKGTMGQTPKKSREEARSTKSSRNDEYLGTDEEDEDDSDGYGGGGDDYYSDASSDMEGGFDDVEAEERAALRAAKEDDAREIALENRLKKEKMDRKQKLVAMAQKRR